MEHCQLYRELLDEGRFMPTFATLCYLWKRDRVLLLRKAEGLFGEGRWNAPGGKLLAGELPERGAAREMQEETGLKVNALRFCGLLNFYLGDKRELDQIVFVFSTKKSSGRVRDSREGELQWFPIKKMPYNEMWEDDRVWGPLLVAGKSFVGDFRFTDGYKKLVDHKVELVH